MTRLLLLAATALLPVAAGAAGHPPIMPQRDVDVSYRLAQADPGGPALTQRMRWSVGTGRLRVDPPSPGLWMVVDYTAKRMSVVKPADRAVLDVPTAGPGLPGGAVAGDYVPRDTTTVAGLSCTNWDTADAAGRPTTLCLTPDGVMLRASQNGQVLLEATTVSYARQDPALFAAPEGFRHVQGGTP